MQDFGRTLHLPGTWTLKLQHDYVPHPIEGERLHTGEPAAMADMPFCGTSTYQMDYANWGAHKLPPLGRCKEDIHGLPFAGQTTYGVDYVPPDLTAKATRFVPPYIASMSLVPPSIRTCHLPGYLRRQRTT